MSYNPPYTDKEWLFENVVIKNRKLQQIADQFGVSRSAVYNWVKKYDLLSLSEEYAKDLSEYRKIQKVRKEWLQQHQIEEEQAKIERKNEVRIIERKKICPITKREIESVIETDIDLSEEDLKKWDEELEIFIGVK